MDNQKRCRCFDKLVEIQKFVTQTLVDCKNQIWDSNVSTLQQERDVLLLRNNELRKQLTALEHAIRNDPFLYEKLRNKLQNDQSAASKDSNTPQRDLLFYKDQQHELEQRIHVYELQLGSWKHRIAEMASKMDAHFSDLIALTKRQSDSGCLESINYEKHRQEQDQNTAQEALKLLKIAKYRIDGDRTRLASCVKRIQELEDEVKHLQATSGAKIMPMPRRGGAASADVNYSSSRVPISPTVLTRNRCTDASTDNRRQLTEGGASVNYEPWVYLDKGYDDDDANALEHYKHCSLDPLAIPSDVHSRRQLIQLYGEMLKAVVATKQGTPYEDELTNVTPARTRTRTQHKLVEPSDDEAAAAATAKFSHLRINRDDAKLLDEIESNLLRSIVSRRTTSEASSVQRSTFSSRAITESHCGDGFSSIEKEDASLQASARSTSNVPADADSAVDGGGNDDEKVGQEQKTNVTRDACARQSESSIESDRGTIEIAKVTPSQLNMTSDPLHVQETNQPATPLEKYHYYSTASNSDLNNLSSLEFSSKDFSQSSIGDDEQVNPVARRSSTSMSATRALSEQRRVLDAELFLLLERVPILSSLPPGRLKSLVAKFRYKTFLPRSAIVLAGEECRNFYILASGTVAEFAYSVKVGASTKTPIRTFKSAEFFGEMQIIDSRCSETFLIAQGHVAVQAMRASDFKEHLQDLFPCFVQLNTLKSHRPLAKETRVGGDVVMAVHVVENLIGHLQGLAILSGLENLGNLAKQFEYHRLGDKEVVTILDEGQAFSILYRGKVILQSKHQGKLVEVATLDPGAYFGGGVEFKDKRLRAIFSNASHVAKGTVLLLGLPRDKFDALDPNVHEDLAQYMETYYHHQIGNVVNEFALDDAASVISDTSGDSICTSTSTSDAATALDEQDHRQEVESSPSPSPSPSSSSLSDSSSASNEYYSTLENVKESSKASAFATTALEARNIQESASHTASQEDDVRTLSNSDNETFSTSDLEGSLNQDDDDVDVDVDDLEFASSSALSSSRDSYLDSSASASADSCKSLLFATLKNKYTNLGAAFVAMDVNGSGLITLDEFVNFIQGLGIGAIDIGELPILFDALKDTGADAITIRSFFMASDETISTPHDFYQRLVAVYKSCRVPFEHHFGPLGRTSTCSRADFVMVAAKVGVDETSAHAIFQACDVCGNDYTTVMTMLKLMRGDWSIDEAKEYEQQQVVTLLADGKASSTASSDDLEMFKREFSSNNMTIAEYFDPGEDVSVVDGELEEFEVCTFAGASNGSDSSGDAEDEPNVQDAIVQALAKDPTFAILSRPQRVYMASYFITVQYDENENHPVVQQGQENCPLVLVLKGKVTSVESTLFLKSSVDYDVGSFCNCADFVAGTASPVSLEATGATLALLSRNVYCEFLQPMFELRRKKVALIAKFLTNLVALKELGDEALHKIANACIVQRFKLHETIYRNGQMPSCLYIIFDGRVEIISGNTTCQLTRFHVLPSLVLESRVVETSAIANSAKLILLTWQKQDLHLFKSSLQRLETSCNTKVIAAAQGTRKVSFAIT